MGMPCMTRKCIIIGMHESTRQSLLMCFFCREWFASTLAVCTEVHFKVSFSQLLSRLQPPPGSMPSTPRGGAAGGVAGGEGGVAGGLNGVGAAELRSLLFVDFLSAAGEPRKYAEASGDGHAMLSKCPWM